MIGLGRLCWAVRCLMLAAAFASVVLRPIQAQPIPVPFPPAPGTAADAAAAFDARAAAVIATNACGREDDYLRFRTRMAKGDFGFDIEDLTSILIGKVAWVQAHRDNPVLILNNDVCVGRMVRPRARNADGTFVQPTLGDFAIADRAARANEPLLCGKETGTESAIEDAIIVEVALSASCMVRQVNEAILAMRKTTQLGSSDLQCADHPAKIKGEFDVTVREVVRLRYLAGPRGRVPGLLEPATIAHIDNELLAARGGLSDGTYSVITGCSEAAGDELGSPEDTADRYAWYNKLAHGIGDFLKWLFHTFVAVNVASIAAITIPGGGVAAPFVIAAGDGLTDIVGIRVPETENHRLMIETSKFLTNAEMIAKLDAEGYDHVDDLREDQAEVRKWLLHRLQDIAAHDFQEYNARPYTRYSLNAVLNLRDFAGDTALATAAGIVLDLSEAKFAATSNRGRRTAPFRRRSENDGYDIENPGPADLYNIVSGGDHEVARAMLLSGQTQLLPDGQPSIAAMAQMVNAATSAYRLPTPVLATAVERRASMQTIRHTGIERVVQSPAFTISAGGVRTGPTGTLLGFSEDSSRGVAMPTTIIPTVAGLQITDLFRFDGVGAQHDRTANTCVAEGFACGNQPNFGALFVKCTRSESTPYDGLWFVSSAVCFPAIAGPHFYLAGRIVDCPDSFCAHGHRWGVMEVVEATPPPAIEKDHALQAAPDPAFTLFQAERRAALKSLNPDGDGNGSYVTAAGHRIDFDVAEAGPKIRAIDGAPPPEGTTAGDAIDADGQGRATLKGSGGPVTIDFSDWSNPKRTP